MEQPVANQSGDTLSGALIALAQTFPADAEKVLNGAGEILGEVPGQQQALLLLASALRILTDAEEARGLIQWMAERYPKLASVQYELALALMRSGLHEDAIVCLNRVVELEPNHAAAWRALGNLYAQKGDRAQAASAYRRHANLTLQELKLLEDTIAAGKDGLAKADNMLRAALDVAATDASMYRMLGKVYALLGHYYQSRAEFARAVELTPQCNATRSNYAESLHQGMLWREAIEQLDMLIAAEPDNAKHKDRKANSLVLVGENEQAFALFDELRPTLRKEPIFWLNLGHSLRMAGRSSNEVAEAYRTGLECDPHLGALWVALANLKSYRFSQADIDTMLAGLKREDLDNTSRTRLEFATGQALEQQKDYAASFEHYSKANVLRREQVHHSAEGVDDGVKRSKALFTPAFFRARQGLGCPSPDPIFILGMVRAGSTLVEQILSSHSLVEGTMELPELNNIVSELIAQHPGQSYPELLADFDGPALTALGEKYLQGTKSRRALDRPYFTDKAGTNFWRTALIQLILPNARIIDARRHPLGCCFSAFKQDFPAASTPHSYDQSELGHYYRKYVELMAHTDKVLPGRVHRVFHEDMVRDPETQIRRLLEYCGLPFEDACLRFYETKRSVRTFSSEQVRKPVSAGTGEQWRHYEAWLGPLKEALGDVLTLYPKVPEFDGT